ncbi:hypothetical protein GCM10022279_05650 [Comamonas faecalis]|uniref:Hemerythrin-like domain-containing protein n=1 Tax=Comamonas faecalis TaxID=1387849 RepID=A0ABP7QN17_9BURK
MNIDKYKHTHVDILQRIDRLRALTRTGVEDNAAAIAQGVVALSAVVKLHLAAEDQALYPSLQRSGNAALAQLGLRFQQEMGPIAAAFDAFAHAWNTPARVRGDEAGFRAAANDVLRRVYERMRQEDRDFYPAIESGA